MSRRIWIPLVLGYSVMVFCQGEFRFLIPDGCLVLGRTTTVPVLLDNMQPVIGYSLSVSFEPAIVHLEGITREGTLLDGVESSYFQARIGEGWATLVAACDTSENLVRREIPVGSDQQIATLVLTPQAEDPVETAVVFESGHGEPFAVDNAAFWFAEGTVREGTAEPEAGSLLITRVELTVTADEAVRPGEEFDLKLVGTLEFPAGSEEHAVTGYAVTLGFDPGTLSFDSCEPSGGPGEVTCEIDNEAGRIHLNVSEGDVPCGRDVLLGVLHGTADASVAKSQSEIVFTGEENFVQLADECSPCSHMAARTFPGSVRFCPKASMCLTAGGERVCVDADEEGVSVLISCGAVISFEDDSLGPTDRLTWDFGDGTVLDKGPIVSHRYTEPGEYRVCLTAANGSEECQSSACAILRVHSDIAGSLGPENPPDVPVDAPVSPEDRRTVLLQFVLDSPCHTEITGFHVEAIDFLTEDGIEEVPQGVLIFPEEWIAKVEIFEDCGSSPGAWDAGDRRVGEGGIEDRFAVVICGTAESLSGSRTYIATCDFKPLAELPYGEFRCSGDVHVDCGAPAARTAGWTPPPGDVDDMRIALAVVVLLIVAAGVVLPERRKGRVALTATLGVFLIVAWIGCSGGSNGGSEPPLPPQTGLNAPYEPVLQVKLIDVEGSCPLREEVRYGPLIRLCEIAEFRCEPGKP